jgi:predicted metal-dependent hydrolase
MDRFMVHLKNSGYVPTDAKTLLAKADQLTSEMNVIVRDMRVSTRCLEFDVSVKKEELDKVVKKFESIGSLDDVRCIIEEKIKKEEALKKAKQYFNDERYWECHEVLEGVWKKTYEGEKNLVQGIILVAAALVHYQKNENEICLSIMKRAMEKLSSACGMYHDVDVDHFRKMAEKIISSKNISPFMI